MRLFLPALLALTLAAACSTKPVVYADAAEVAAVRFVAPPPATITLFTSINRETGSGAHSGLMISGRERVLFDPAGTFVYDGAPERHDVKYGMSDRSVNVYQDFHVRPDFNLVEQTLVVPQSVADDLIAMAEAAGPVDDAFCASSIVALLRSQPGFEGMRSTLFPRALSDDFGRLPGVNTILRTQENFVAFHGVPFVDEEPVNLTN